MGSNKILVTGIGSITPAGNTNDLWNAILNKENHLSNIDNKTGVKLPAKVVGKVDSELFINVLDRVKKYVSRHTLLGNTAFTECYKDSGLEQLSEPKNGLIFGSASLGQDVLKDVYTEVFMKDYTDADYNVLNTISNAGAAQLIAATNNVNGFVQGIEGASCSGILAIINAINLINSGNCDRVFCNIGDANLFPSTMLYYNRKIRMKGTSYTFFGKLGNAKDRNTENYILPFADIEHSDRGAIAEGGAAILLESEDAALKRKAKIYGEISDADFCFHADNYHGTDKDKLGLKEVTSKFKNNSFRSIYLSATGCYPLDATTIEVCSQLFPNTHSFSAEAVIGHTGATSSLLNIILALKSINNNILLPTKNYNPEIKDPACMLIPSIEIIKDKSIDNILIISTGFGGYNGACRLQKYE